MAFQDCKLINLLLGELFGPVIAAVADELKWGPKPLKLLSSAAKLPLSTVKQALSILIQFNFVQYKLSARNSICEYSLIPENILLITRYSKFILLARKRFSKEGEVLIEELLHSGKMTLTNLILKVTYTLAQGNSEMAFSLSSIKNSVCELIDNGFVIPVERVTQDVVPTAIKLTENEKIPNINVKKLSALYQGTDTEMSSNELFWRVNFERFLVEFRNEILISAMSRRFDIHAGVVVQHLLKLSHQKMNLWQSVTNPISMMQIRDSIGNDSNGTYPLKYAEQYIKIMEEDSCGFVTRRATDIGGGVILCIKDVIEHLTSLCISQVIDQKFGFKAARVFRLIQVKKFCELEHIQQQAMLPDKEAKNITYKLLEENFIQMQELRKPSAGSSSGPNKAFFLFYVDINVIVRMLLGMCYKAIYNVILRRKEEENKQNHIIEKKKQAELMVALLKEQEASEEEIENGVDAILTPPEKMLLDGLQKITKRLQLAELQIDETIFILQMYIRYNKALVPETKLKKRG